MPRALFLIVISIAIGCGGRTASPESKIPADVSYSVIKTETVPGTKRVVNVRLNKAVSEEVIGAIAEAVKLADSGTYERTFIFYYLPDMKPGEGAWATSHFNPSLKVEILGLTAQQEQSLSAPHDVPGRQMIGRWLDQSIGVGGHIEIFKSNERLAIELTFKDGSTWTCQLAETQNPNGRQFRYADRMERKDSWMINSKGDLEILSNGRLIATAKKVANVD